MSNDLAGVDDLVAEIALTRRARQRRLADASNALCGLRFTHPRWPAERDSNGYLVVDGLPGWRPRPRQLGRSGGDQTTGSQTEDQQERENECHGISGSAIVSLQAILSLLARPVVRVASSLALFGGRALTAASESYRSLMLRTQFGVERSRPRCSALAAEPCTPSRDAPTTEPNGGAPTERRTP
jgi:hypothetical protein